MPGPVGSTKIIVRRSKADIILVRVHSAEQNRHAAPGRLTDVPVVTVPAARRAHQDAPWPEPPAGMALRALVDDADSPRDVLDLLILDAFAVGRHPYARSVSLESVRPDARLAPQDGQLVREAIDDNTRVRLYRGEGWSLRSTHWPSGRRADLVATAVTHDLAAAVLTTATDGATEDLPPAPERVPIGFWHLSAHGPRRHPRDIDTPDWAQIRRNYTERVATAVDTLMALDGHRVHGRLLLVHGQPGTGKTTLLRALARSWRAWCQVDCVLDPERLFSEPGYLMDVALGVHDDDGEERWRLLLLEDCDELIRSEAKASTGQALSRLLNLTDGMLGQGRNVLVAITTNEDLSRLHPAVVRPGRGLAQLEVGRLTPAEARAWLPDDRALPAQVRTEGATLAELFALSTDGGTPLTATEPDETYGCYL